MSAQPGLPPGRALFAYLHMLAGERPDGRFLDIRWMTRAGMRRQFVPAAHLASAARLIERLAPHHDVYVGIALRSTARQGGRRAIANAHLLHVDCDTPAASDRLATFQPASMLIASGTPGHLHAYWQLQTSHPGEQVEAANRLLAVHLAADVRSADLARVLRPPASLNHKHTPPAEVTLLTHHPERLYALSELTVALPDPPPRLRVQPHRPNSPDPLRAIPAATYVQILTGAQPNAAGKLLCPFHAEQTPSLQLYPDNTWFCFGCRQGGSIYDFAATCWRLPTKGVAFGLLHRRLVRVFDSHLAVR